MALLHVCEGTLCAPLYGTEPAALTTITVGGSKRGVLTRIQRFTDGRCIRIHCLNEVCRERKTRSEITELQRNSQHVLSTKPRILIGC
jgi:hypothetical protein